VLVSIEAARPRRLRLTFPTPERPPCLGAKVLDDVSLGSLEPFIDWTPFFTTWELAGQFPAILNDKGVGAAARPPQPGQTALSGGCR